MKTKLMMTQGVWGTSLLAAALVGSCSPGESGGDGDGSSTGTITGDGSGAGSGAAPSSEPDMGESGGDGSATDELGGATNDEMSSGGDAASGPTSSGGAATGGESAAGGDASGGAASGGAASGGAASGGAASGGESGSGGSDPVDGVVCIDGCVLATVPFIDFGTGTDFEVQFDPASDLSNSIVTMRVFVEMEGNTGGMQLYAKNGSTQNYASKYDGWTNLSDATSAWTDITMDLSTVSDPDGNFSKSEVVWIGLNVAAGGDWSGAQLGIVKIYIEDITFSAGATDIKFAADVQGLTMNAFNSPISGSSTQFTSSSVGL